MFTTRRITTSGGDKFRDEYSLAFDGTNDYLTMGNVLNLGTADFTISIWAKCASWGGDARYLISKREDNDDRWYIRIKDDDPPVLQLYTKVGGTDVGKNQFFGDNTVSPSLDDLNGQWVHFCISSDRDGNNMGYINGVLNDTDSASTATMDNDGDLEIARYGTVEFGGNISEVTIYNKALTTSEVKTIYNGREPYNHKEGVCSSNLQAWWRMGDGSSNNRKFQYIDNSASSAGSKLIMSSTFDSDEDGWEDHSSGTVARSTDISSHSGSAGVLKCTTDTTSQWLGKTVNITSGMESGKMYIAEGYVYIPSSWSGTRDIYIYSADQFGDSATNIGEHDYNTAQHETKDEWQHIFYTFLCKEDSGSGAIYLRAAGGDNLEDGDFVYLDDFKITEIDKLNSGVIINMDATDFEGDTP